MTKAKKLKICNKVILHWWENLFLAYAEDLQESDLNSNKCEFCIQVNFDCFGVNKTEICNLCPICRYTKKSFCNGTNYHIILNRLAEYLANDKKLINLVSGMLTQLEEICDKWLNDNNN